MNVCNVLCLQTLRWQWMTSSWSCRRGGRCGKDVTPPTLTPDTPPPANR